MLAKLMRTLLLGAVFFLPEHKRIALDRRLRGREEQKWPNLAKGYVVTVLSVEARFARLQPDHF